MQTYLSLLLAYLIFKNGYEDLGQWADLAWPGQVIFNLCFIVLGLTVVSMVLTYFYSTDTFILASCLVVTWRLHRLYPHQVPQVN